MIAAFTTPAMGHVKPMLPVLAGLVDRGLPVTCFGHVAFERVIAATGAAFVPYPDIDYDIDAPDFNLVQMAADLIDASEAITRALLPAVEALGPRLIVQDFMAPWASRIGTALAIPRVHTVPTLVFNRETVRLMRREDGMAKTARDVVSGLPSLIGAMIRSRGAVTVGEAFALEGSWRRLAPPVGEIVFGIEALQPGRTRGDVPRHYVGPGFVQPAAPSSTPSATGPVLVTFGTLSNNETERFAAAMRGAFTAGHSVLAQCGGKVDLDRLRRLGRDLETRHPGQTATVLDTVADLETLIADASLVVHHAGLATTWETARHHRPALLIPTIADQKVLSVGLEREGFGLRLAPGRERDADAIAAGLRAVAGREYDWARIDGLIQRAGGPERAVDVVAGVLGDLA